MIYSMTAFARMQSQGTWGNLTCEMRSINHRYLEINVYLPELFRALEMPIRERLRQALKRGKVECALKFQPNLAGDNLFTVNTTLVQSICKAAESIATHAKTAAPINPVDVLRFPGVMETKELELGVLKDEVLGLIDKTTAELIAAREREGNELKQLFLNRMELIQQELSKVRTRLPQVINDARERLLKRFTDVKVELDPNRLEQEMVMFAQKIDVMEELERTDTHIAEVKRTLNQGGLVGRRLDFISQELNREANTLGSKSVDPVVTHAAVEMKVLIEQIREQVQNVE